MRIIEDSNPYVVANLKTKDLRLSQDDKITVANKQLIITTFKPKVVEMHSREHLQNFRDARVAGVGYNWPEWRFSIELGSNLYVRMLKEGERKKF